LTGTCSAFSKSLLRPTEATATAFKIIQREIPTKYQQKSATPLVPHSTGSQRLIAF